MKAPFPWFGGKSRAASMIWDALGDVPSYVEPFAGSLAVLLARPTTHKNIGRCETVNDLDCFVANFWRALQADPEGVQRWADWPVNEADLHARHRWLMDRADWRERMHTDPDHYDVKIAGWWVWGQSTWIGSGWCGGKLRQQLPVLGTPGHGVHSEERRRFVWTLELSTRLRSVRVACGDWMRIMGESVTNPNNVKPCGVLLDPPYSATRADVYAQESDVSADVRAWALEHGDDPRYRIVLCGYDGEHNMPGWRCVDWKAKGGYGSQGNGQGRENAAKERLWLSPHCLTGASHARQGVLL